ncbi:hypothetical protein [Catenibacterium sp.]|uniref:hypothetical protein n=1 Tax=Catenibacterium sp. TaxID=2049022 RepID=UPI00399588F2
MGYIDIDLEVTFDTVNHDKLISLVMKDVKSGEIVSLIKKIPCPVGSWLIKRI